MYLCYELNHGNYEFTCGSINGHLLFEDIEHAVEWLRDSVKIGAINNFILHGEYRWTNNNDNINDSVVIQDLEDGHSISIDMATDEDNYKLLNYYEIVVENIEVEEWRSVNV